MAEISSIFHQFPGTGPNCSFIAIKPDKMLGMHLISRASAQEPSFDQEFVEQKSKA